MSSESRKILAETEEQYRESDNLICANGEFAHACLREMNGSPYRSEKWRLRWLGNHLLMLVVKVVIKGRDT